MQEFVGGGFQHLLTFGVCQGGGAVPAVARQHSPCTWSFATSPHCPWKTVPCLPPLSHPLGLWQAEVDFYFFFELLVVSYLKTTRTTAHVE